MGTLRAGPGHKGTRSQVRSDSCVFECVRVRTYVRCGYICNSQKTKTYCTRSFFVQASGERDVLSSHANYCTTNLHTMMTEEGVKGSINTVAISCSNTN